MTKQLARYSISSSIVYFIVLLVYLAASYYPNLRLWGLDWWAYYPQWAAVGLFLLGLLVLAGAIYLSQKDADSELSEEIPKSSQHSLWWLLPVIAGAGVLFYLLRVRTHFLGDGYNILTQFEQGLHLVKYTDWGESLMHIELKKLLGGDNVTASLASFRIISIVSGLGFVAFVLYSARRLFERGLHRAFFALGLLTGGYMLLFFGYVEYYSCFAALVGIFSLTGVMVACNKINRWFILPPLLLAIFCQVFGLLLIPAAVYILMSKSKIAARLTRLSLPVRGGIFLIVMIIAGVLFYLYYMNNLFFRLSFVAPFDNSFTLAGYTLFSPAHLADVANLLLVLIPSLPLLVVLFFFTGFRKIFGQPVYNFLVVLNICTLGAVFLMDPNLGMPRDWDFFAFAGVTLAVLGFYFLLDRGPSLKGWRVAAVLSVSLSLLVLGPRVAGQSMPKIIISHFKTYLTQNRQIDREGRIFLIEYYHRTGDAVAEMEQRQIWNEHDLEGRQVNVGQAFFEQENYSEAMKAFRKAIKYNPSHSPAYNNLGRCFFKTQQYDSALYYLKIAEAFNPYNAPIITNLGMAYMYVGNQEMAEKFWRRALEISDTLLMPMINLLQLYDVQMSEDKFFRQLEMTGRHENAPMEIVRRLAQYYLDKGDFDQAAVFYRKALEKGLDSAYIVELQKKYPELQVF
jgi:hypothetical protein